VKFGWIPREQNKHADALANAAMDAGSRRPSAGPSAGTTEAIVAAVSGVTAAPGPWEPPTAAAISKATRLILVRHGETALTAERRYSGRGDVELSELGLAQAQAAAGRIAGLVAAAHVAAVVSSPLARCRRTAELIAAAAGTARPTADGPAADVPVVVEPDLVETDFGDWEGKTFAEVRAQWPAEMDAWLASTSVAPPGGESLQAVGVRVRRVVAKLLDSYPESVVVVVSHVSPLKLMLRDALAASDAFLHRLYLDPTGISIMDSWRDGGVAVYAVNDTAHLAGLS
jgi:broad specificity phosphatase PhoE